MQMNKTFIEPFCGEAVCITMIDDMQFKGVLYLVHYEDESEEKVHSILLSTFSFFFRVEHIKKIELQCVEQKKK